MVCKRAGDGYAGRRTRSWLKASAAAARSSSSAASPSRRAPGPAWARCCSASTTRRARCATPAASARASTTRALPRLRSGSRRSSGDARRSRTRRAGRGPRRALGRRSWSPRSRSPSGPGTAGCASPSSRVCARTRARAEVRRGARRSRRARGATAAARQARRAGGGAAEAAAPAAASGPAAPPRQAGRSRGVRITHPDRLVFPDPGTHQARRRRVLRARAGPWCPYLGAAPLTVIRCPDGVGAECFFQKHVDAVGASDASSRTVRVRGERGA